MPFGMWDIGGMRFIRFLLSLSGRIWIAMTGHLVAGGIGVFEHITGHSVAGWWCFAVCWVAFYMGAYLFYEKTKQQNNSEFGKLQNAMTEQAKEVLGINYKIRSGETEREQLVAQVGQLHRELENILGGPSIVAEFSEVPLSRLLKNRPATA